VAQLRWPEPDTGSGRASPARLGLQVYVGVTEMHGRKELEAREHQNSGDGQLLHGCGEREGGWRAARNFFPILNIF
jgi:hypothetical protein